ncbi:MAG: hypothetical protein Q4D13_00610 [Erysipelotrichaceae bacterium]|nr:hypothetical protein [Erysipelotrichaceae bacterium]
MNAFVVTCFESNEERVGYIKKILEKQGYKTDIITSDFSHIRKEERNNVPEGYIAIDTKPYKKNLSIARLASHDKFAKEAFEVLKKEKPDFIWLMAPANSLIKEANKYKNNNPDTKLVIDIIDMWPESLPVSVDKNMFPLNLWKNIRKDNIRCADILVGECALYNEILSKEYGKDIRVLRWAKEDKAMESVCEADDDILSLIYLGSINNIIDIEGIKKMIRDIDYSVKLNIIGEGEKTDEFINSLKEVCEVEYHGVIRDEERKAPILKKCHAGINFYKEGLYIGLTVKCIDYFLHGLPILNNIKGDTWKMVEEDGVGFNIEKGTVIDAKKLIELRKDNKKFTDFYNEHFTYEIFEKECVSIIEELKK